jgi:CHAD domain-containing protein
MTKDIKTPEEAKEYHDCRLLRIRARKLRYTAQILEEMAEEMERQCGCNTLSLGGK